MKIIRAAHIPWALFVLAASAVAAVLYVAQFYPQRVPPGFRFFGEMPPGHATIGGTPLGLVFGAISFAIFIFAVLLGLRKKLPHFPIGHVQAWMRAHIWLTLLTVPLILLHSGFHLGSPMTTLLMALYAVVMLSGIYGLILQQKMPGWMKDQLPAEVVYEQIPNIREKLCLAARQMRRSYRPEVEEERVAHPASPAAPEATLLANKTATAVVESSDPDVITDAASDELLADFIERQLLPYLQARRGNKFRFGHASVAGDAFRYLKLRVPASYHEAVDEMEGWATERRHLDVQVKMQHWLHGWLFVHVPLSFLLLLLTAWHAFVTLFRY